MIRLDLSESERLKRFFFYQQLPQSKRSLPVKALAGCAVDVPYHLVYIRLREFIEGTSFGQDFTDILVVFLASRFLPGCAGVAVIDTRASRRVHARFQRVWRRELSAAVCENHREDGAENGHG